MAATKKTLSAPVNSLDFETKTTSAIENGLFFKRDFL
jgi:hypothetical protein